MNILSALVNNGGPGSGRHPEGGASQGNAPNEDHRQFHMALTRIGYGLGRPRVSGNDLIYSTSDPEDARDIASDVPKIGRSCGVNATAKSKGRDMIVTIHPRS
jgi:hypothetical protein